MSSGICIEWNRLYLYWNGVAKVMTALLSFGFSKVVPKHVYIIHGNLELMTDKSRNLKSNQAYRFRDEVHACRDPFNATETAGEHMNTYGYAKHGR